MKTFNDNAGRTWTVTINVDAFKRVKTLLGVNLMEAVEGKLLERLVADPILLCDVIYAVCKPQADAANVTDVQFGQAMGGDAIDLATTALLEELCDFFPQGRRTLLRKALEKLQRFQTLAYKTAGERLDSPEMEKKLQAILSNSMDGALNSAAAPGLTPAPSPSVS
jgi:hypothetical protein